MKKQVCVCALPPEREALRDFVVSVTLSITASLGTLLGRAIYGNSLLVFIGMECISVKDEICSESSMGLPFIIVCIINSRRLSKQRSRRIPGAATAWDWIESACVA